MLESIDGESIQGILGVMVPIVAIVGGLSLGAASMYLKSRERMEMISRGMDVAAMEKARVETYNGRLGRRSPLRSGLIVLGVGVGLLLAYFICNSNMVPNRDEDHTVIYIAFVALFVGAALILSHLMEKRGPVNGANGLQ
jgi:hypothetical protein